MIELLQRSVALANLTGETDLERTHLGPYQIVAHLGAGGMGEVFRALDNRLKREVAIKVLPGRLAEDSEARSRFEHEAQVVAALSHPNILSIHDFGQDEGVTYAVMELLEGETLRQRMERVNLSAQKSVELALQIATGLAAAHARGVVHRDLKPENLFITTDGLLKILDFGLSTYDPVGMSSATETEMATVGYSTVGVIAGTLAYMSPEQLRGEEMDHRSDIFSFGVVLYEMLASHRPFQGPSTPDLMGAILKDSPAELPQSSVAASPALRRILSRCLEKLRDERFQSARDLAFALEAMSDFYRQTSSGHVEVLPAEVEETPASVAVLPFTNMSPDPDQEYFCEGMAEEIINALARIQDLRVVARASAFQFKGEAKDIREVGNALNVGTVLDGSVRTAGNRLRVTVQLVEVESGFQLWNERYDRTMDDVFAVQDEIAENIVQALQVELGGAREDRDSSAVARPTESLEAYQCYLKGQHYWYKRERGSLKKAAEFFDKATSLDPNYALAYAGVANAYSSLAYYDLAPQIAAEKARAALERAQSLDAELPEVQAAAGLFEVNVNWDWANAERQLAGAIAGNPCLVRAHCWYSFLLNRLSRQQEALSVAQKAIELDPLSTYAITATGLCHLSSGDFDKAIGVLKEAQDLDADYLYTLWALGSAYGAAGRAEESIATFDRAVLLSGQSSYYLSWLGWAYGIAGRRREAEEVLERLAVRGQSEYVSPFCHAQVWSGLGEVDRATDFWAQACEEKNAPAAYVTWSAIAPLCSSPRGKEILRRLNLPV